MVGRGIAHRWIEKYLLVLGGTLAIVTIGLGAWCTVIGSPLPDAASGLTYPINMHGKLYVVPLLGKSYSIMTYLSILTLAPALVLRFVRMRAEGRETTSE